MKTCYYYLTLLFVVCALNSCSNEVDVLADYEENAVVYGLLDPSQPVQFVKINKVFTNPNAAAGDIAKIADSLFFDTLSPTLTEVGTGRVIQLKKANVLLKANGYFANSPNYLYATSEKISAAHLYRLDMRLPKSDKYVTSTTNIPDSVRINSPSSILGNPGLIELLLDSKLTLQFNSTVKSKIYDAYFYFNYMEVNKADTNIRVIKTIRWRLLNKLRSSSDLYPEPFTLKISNSSFYDLLLSLIPVDPSLQRRILPGKLELTAGNLELDNYIQATEPSIGIVQKQTEYSNIKNGIGIFASRRLTVYNNIVIGNKTKSTLVTGSAFKQLGFVN